VTGDVSEITYRTEEAVGYSDRQERDESEGVYLVQLVISDSKLREQRQFQGKIVSSLVQ
jgi:hypothetical protein